MRVRRSIEQPVRTDLTWEQLWEAQDGGLIACWERGREKARDDKALASEAKQGRLVALPWKGGVEKAIKKQVKYGTLYYLAMWQGLRGDDLNIDPQEEVAITCSSTCMTVRFTGDFSKYSAA